MQIADNGACSNEIMETFKTISVENKNVRLDRYIRIIFHNLKQSVIEKSLRRGLKKVGFLLG
jgi:23S rRNA pseudouridine955/2504/2580 synthase